MAHIYISTATSTNKSKSTMVQESSIIILWQISNHCVVYWFVCSFVCMGFIVSIQNFSLIWRHHYYRWRAENFDLCSALMAIEQWENFSVPHLLWHEASIYNGLLRGPVTLIPTAERLSSGVVTNCLNDLGLLRLGFEHPTFRLRDQRSKPLHHHRGRSF